MSNVGKLNRYTCVDCGHRIVTIDREEGVTPFMIDCKREGGGACESGSMHSSCYRLPPVLAKMLTPTHEWRKPSAVEYATLSRGARDHVERGGLMIYPIPGQTSVAAPRRAAGLRT